MRWSLDVPSPSKNPLLAALLLQSELTMITVLLADQFVVNITATRGPVEIIIATLRELLSLLSSYEGHNRVTKLLFSLTTPTLTVKVLTVIVLVWS